MGLREQPVGSEGSPSLGRDDDESGRAAAAIAAAAAAAAADGLVLGGRHGDGGPEGPDGGSDSDAMGCRSPLSPSMDMQASDDGMPQTHQAKGKQRAQSALSGSGTPTRAQEESGKSSGLPFRPVINAACTSSSLRFLAEAFPFIAKAPCICLGASRCKFGGELGPQQLQQRQVLRMLMQETEATAEKQNEMEEEPFSLFAAPRQVFASSCCDRHAIPQQAADGGNKNGNSSAAAGASPPSIGEEGRKECNWEAFAASLDKELDAIMDEVSPAVCRL